MEIVKRGRGRPAGSTKEVIAARKANEIKSKMNTASEDIHADRSDAEVLAIIQDRFEFMMRLVAGSASGGVPRSLIVSGAPGVGKTYNIENYLRQRELAGDIRFFHLKSASASGPELYKTLYQYRAPNDVLLIDDSDDVFFDPTTINLLKGALDTSPVRHISWLKDSYSMQKEDIPQTMEYLGSIIFITNLDFHRYTENTDGTNKIAEHLKALISRSFYVDLAIHHRRHLALWVKYVIQKFHILKDMDLFPDQQQMVMKLLDKYRDQFMTYDIRNAMKVGMLMKIEASAEVERRVVDSLCRSR